jgi:hypothetical protein
LPESTHTFAAHTWFCPLQSALPEHCTHVLVTSSQIVVVPRFLQSRLVVHDVGAAHAPATHRAVPVHSLSKRHCTH